MARWARRIQAGLKARAQVEDWLGRLGAKPPHLTVMRLARQVELRPAAGDLYSRLLEIGGQPAADLTNSVAAELAHRARARRDAATLGRRRPTHRLLADGSLEAIASSLEADLRAATGRDDLHVRYELRPLIEPGGDR